MQTDQLTTTLAGALVPPSLKTISCSGQGEGTTDFAAFLLALLSMGSLPFEAQAPASGESPAPNGEQPAGEGTRLHSPLLMALLSNQEAICSSVAGAHHGDNDSAGERLPAGSAQQSPTPLLLLSSGLAALPRDIESPTYAKYTEEWALSDPLAANLLSSAELSADSTPVILPPAESAGRSDAQAPKLPTLSAEQDACPESSGGRVRLSDKEDTGLKPSGYGTELLDTQDNKLRPPICGIELPGKQDVESRPSDYEAELPGKRRGLYAGPRGFIAARTSGKTGTAVFVHQSLSVELPVRPVIPGQEIEIRSNTPSPIFSSQKAGILSVPAAQVLGSEGGQAGIALKNIAAVFPGTKVESVKVSAGKSNANEPDQLLTGNTKTGSGSAPASDQVITLVDREVPENQKKAATPVHKRSIGRQPSATGKQALSTPTTLTPPEEMRIKPEEMPLNMKTAERHLPLIHRLDSAVPAKGSADPPPPAAPQRAQFTIEPESLRPSLKAPAEIRLKLHPETLGTVRLHLRTVGNHLAARVVVQSPAARLAVEGNLANLQRILADAGLVIDRFEVTVGHTTSASPAYPDSPEQKRRYAFKPKTNRRYRAVADVNDAGPVQAQRVGVTAGLGGGCGLNLLA